MFQALAMMWCPVLLSLTKCLCRLLRLMVELLRLDLYDCLHEYFFDFNKNHHSGCWRQDFCTYFLSLPFLSISSSSLLAKRCSLKNVNQKTEEKCADGTKDGLEFSGGELFPVKKRGNDILPRFFCSHFVSNNTAEWLFVFRDIRDRVRLSSLDGGRL